MDNKRKIDSLLVALMIHGFTIAHAIVATMSGPLAGPTLTPMTTAMVVAIAWLCGAKPNVQLVVKTMGLFLAKLLGVSVSQFILGFFPGLNIINGLTSAAVTELIGWAVFVLFRDDLDKNDNVDVDDLLAKAKIEQKRHAEFMKQLNKALWKMSFREKREYKDYMEIVTSENYSEKYKEEAFNKAKALMEKYGVKFPDDKPPSDKAPDKPTPDNSSST